MPLSLAKAWVTLKRFWWVPLILVLVPLAYVLLGRSSGSGLIKAVRKTADARKEELEALERAAREEREATARAKAEHDAAVKREADEHERRLRELKLERESRAVELSRKPVSDLADRLSKLIDDKK